LARLRASTSSREYWNPLRSAARTPGDPQLVELVVLADAGERDAVVDLAHLAQRLRRVLGDDHDAVGVPDRGQRPTARDALAREVGAVLHHLLGSDVERHAHRERTSATIAMIRS
jgi:hypothetical protein